MLFMSFVLIVIMRRCRWRKDGGSGLTILLGNLNIRWKFRHSFSLGDIACGRHKLRELGIGHFVLIYLKGLDFYGVHRLFFWVALVGPHQKTPAGDGDQTGLVGHSLLGWAKACRYAAICLAIVRRNRGREGVGAFCCGGQRGCCQQPAYRQQCLGSGELKGLHPDPCSSSGCCCSQGAKPDLQSLPPRCAWHIARTRQSALSASRDVFPTDHSARNGLQPD